MKDSLERKSLPVRLADIIEKEIRAGDWQTTLAGHRTLMARYSVSAKTTLAAIEQLEARGLISNAEQGKKRRILVKPEETRRALTDLLIVNSMGAQSGEDIQQMQAYRRAWEEAGGRVQSIKFDFPRYRKPEALLREAVSNHNADALLLHVPPLAWVAAAAKLRPVFLAGGEWKADDTTAVGYNVKDEVTLQAAKLRELGHQRIVVPLDLVGSKMEKAVREGLATGLGVPSDTPELRECCPIYPEKVPEAWQQYWKKTFATVRPTAIILTDDIHYLSLCGYCFRNGIRIPKDLSVVCLESTEHLEWCDPVPTRMRYPIDAAVRHFRKWIRGGCVSIGKKTLPLETIEAGTVARAPR
jgi:DNA-binding LacI/PurR family transcriptional regulator